MRHSRSRATSRSVRPTSGPSSSSASASVEMAQARARAAISTSSLTTRSRSTARPSDTSVVVSATCAGHGGVRVDGERVRLDAEPSDLAGGRQQVGGERAGGRGLEVGALRSGLVGVAAVGGEGRAVRWSCTSRAPFEPVKPVR